VTAAQPGAWIEDLTWPEVGQRLADGATVILPIGARAKEHGHHLPMKTDYLLARALCDGIAARLPVLVAPVVDFGYYPAFVEYPGSQHLRPETFTALLQDIIDGLIRHKARRIAIVNTGVSTEGPVTTLVREIYQRSDIRIPVAHIRALGTGRKADLQQKLGGHADEHETSIIMAIEPGSVHLDRAVPDYGNMLTEPKTVFYLPTIFRGDPHSGPDYSAQGARGDPTLATAGKGRAALKAMIDELVEGLDLLDGRP
jgi:creatinine amidohydrolase